MCEETPPESPEADMDETPPEEPRVKNLGIQDARAIWDSGPLKGRLTELLRDMVRLVGALVEGVDGKTIPVDGVYALGTLIREMSRYIPSKGAYHKSEIKHPFFKAMRAAIVHTYAIRAITSAKEAGVERPILVEPGAGTGLVSREMAEAYPEATVILVEKDLEYYEFLKKRLQGPFSVLGEDGEEAMEVSQLPDNVRVLHGDATKISLPETGAHVIYMSFALHHIEPWELVNLFRRIAEMMIVAELKNPGCNPIFIVGDENLSENYSEDVTRFKAPSTHSAEKGAKERIIDLHGVFLGMMAAARDLVETGMTTAEELIRLSLLDQASRKSQVLLIRSEIDRAKETKILPDDYKAPTGEEEWASLRQTLEQLLPTLKREKRLIKLLEKNEENSRDEGIRVIDQLAKTMHQAELADITINGEPVDRNHYPSPIEWLEIIPQLQEHGIELPVVGEIKMPRESQDDAAIYAGLEPSSNPTHGPTGRDGMEGGGGVCTTVYELGPKLLKVVKRLREKGYEPGLKLSAILKPLLQEIHKPEAELLARLEELLSSQ